MGTWFGRSTSMDADPGLEARCVFGNEFQDVAKGPGDGLITTKAVDQQNVFARGRTELHQPVGLCNGFVHGVLNMGLRQQAHRC